MTTGRMMGRRVGFNAQWMMVEPGRPVQPPDERMLDFLAAEGFDLLRLPTDYRAWTTGFDYLHPDERVFEAIDAILAACRARGIHLALNLHRAPGYCITRWDLERHDLWHDAEPQAAFRFLWRTFAQRYKGVPAAELSFDLVNEPPALGLRGFDRDVHAALIRGTVAAIRAVDAERPITIDGLDGGNLAMPELAALAADGVGHSGRGYQPYPVSHWGATWWDGWREGDAPRWPGVVYEGRAWGRADLEAFYAPWRAVEATGVDVHIGEFGCYEQTPDADAQRWFADLVGLFREYGWGWALWNFEGPFGIIGHHRPGARFEPYRGYQVDRALLELIRP